MKYIVVWLRSGGIRQIEGVAQMEITGEHLTLYVGAMREKVRFDMSDVYKADVLQDTQQLACL